MLFCCGRKQLDEWQDLDVHAPFVGYASRRIILNAVDFMVNLVDLPLEQKLEDVQIHKFSYLSGLFICVIDIKTVGVLPCRALL